MKKITKNTEKGLLIGSVIFWVVLLIFATLEYDTLSFNFKRPVMLAFWIASLLTIMQWLLCIGLPIGAIKHRRKNYIHNNKEISIKDIKKHRIQAIKIAVIWIVFLICEKIFLCASIVDQRFIIVGMIILRIADRLFVLVWCPFGAIMKNRCCSDCRIYGWDQLMLNSPMIFYITTPFVAILIVLAMVSFIEWEISHWRHPERFSSETNKGITCKYCNGVCGRCKKI